MTFLTSKFFFFFFDRVFFFYISAKITGGYQVDFFNLEIFFFILQKSQGGISNFGKKKKKKTPTKKSKNNFAKITGGLKCIYKRGKKIENQKRSKKEKSNRCFLMIEIFRLFGIEYIFLAISRLDHLQSLSFNMGFFNYCLSVSLLRLCALMEKL